MNNKTKYKYTHTSEIITTLSIQNQIIYVLATDTE